MKFFKAAAAAISLLAVSATGAFAQCDDGEMVIKFSHVVAATGHPKGDAATLLAERVNEEMNGKACMEVFPNSTLYRRRQGDGSPAARRRAARRAVAVEIRGLHQEVPPVRPAVPVFQDLDAFDTSPFGRRQWICCPVIEPNGYTGLGYWSSGMKQFSANKPLLVPSDANGLKFRVQTSDVAVAMIEAMGASAQKLAFKEVYGALQTGVVDGQENTWSNIYTQKFFEVQDGITETNHQLLAYLLVTSTEWLNGLDADVRDQFLAIVDDVTRKANAQVADKEAANRRTSSTPARKCATLTPEQRAEWVATMKPVWEQFEGDIGKDLIDAAVSSNGS
jgi:C4-dicarboxylate-binding protein DctP